MARTAHIPSQLTRRPFSLDEARAAGVNLSALKGKSWKRLGRELYCWKALALDPWAILAAWQRSLPKVTRFSGGSSAWLFGMDLEAVDPVEIVAPVRCGIRSQAGLSVRRCAVPDSEAVTVRGLRATSVNWTLGDLCIRRSEVEALIAIDMAVRQRLTDPVALSDYCRSHAGQPGINRLRALSSLAAPAESPMETRLRWLLIRAGLPVPEVQVQLHNSDRRFLGRVDLYYPSGRLAIEYDGDNHRERLVEDNRRQNLLLSAGYSLLRFTAADIYRRPEAVAALVKGTVDAKRTEFSKPSAPLTSNRRNVAMRLA